MKDEEILLTWRKQCQSKATDKIGEAHCRRSQAFEAGCKDRHTRKLKWNYTEYAAYEN
jgi:hypothetical protein